jgi:hypothetical protein
MEELNKKQEIEKKRKRKCKTLLEIFFFYFDVIQDLNNLYRTFFMPMRSFLFIF